MGKSCHNCKYLSKDGSHLENDYLKQALTTDEAYHTCKAPGDFNEQWVFGLTKLEPYRSDMMCAGEDHQPTGTQLKLFIA